MDNKLSNTNWDNSEIDLLAIAALKDDYEFENLFMKFKPFLRGQASKWSGSSSSLRDDMMSSAMLAFHEAVKSYDKSKGHFYSLLKNVVHKRLVDCYRNLKANKVETVPLETEADEGVTSHLIDDASIKAHQKASQQRDLVLEIEEFKQELAEWGITMEMLAENSPKQAKTRAAYREIAKLVVMDDEILRIFQTMHYFPIKKVLNLTKSSPKIIERARIYIIACLIIHIGEYEYLKGYVC